jgi:hypothetical protein
MALRPKPGRCCCRGQEGKLFDQAVLTKQVLWCGLLEKLVDEFRIDGGCLGHVVLPVGLSG